MGDDGKVLVTGAGGFIGGWLVESLYLSGSTDVRAGIHNWTGAARPARFPLDIVLCDIMDPAQLGAAMTGVACVIHCAKGSPETIVPGTRNMLEVALKHKVKRFVHVSTTAVYGDLTGNLDETIPCQTTGDPYGDSKIEAEKLCWQYHEKGMPIVVIRPPIVYGPFSRWWTVDIAMKLQSRNWGVFRGQADGIANLIFVADLVSGILLAASHERAVGEIFVLNGPEAPTWNQYFQKFNAAMGLPPLKMLEPGQATRQANIMESLQKSAKFIKKHFGGPVQHVAARCRPLKQTMKFLQQKLKTTPRRSDFDLFDRNVLYSYKKAQNQLGFNPRFNLDAGLALTVSWMNQVGLWERQAWNGSAGCARK